MFGDSAGVGLGDGDNVVLDKILLQWFSASPVAGIGAELAHHTTFRARSCRLDILFIDAVVANEGVRHGDDLAVLGGIGEYLLVAGHRGVEDDLARGDAGSAKRNAVKEPVVFQREDAFRHGFTSGAAVWRRQNS